MILAKSALLMRSLVLPHYVLGFSIELVLPGVQCWTKAIGRTEDPMDSRHLHKSFKSTSTSTNWVPARARRLHRYPLSLPTVTPPRTASSGLNGEARAVVSCSLRLAARLHTQFGGETPSQAKSAYFETQSLKGQRNSFHRRSLAEELVV